MDVVTCINNEDYPASLEVGKQYEVLRDEWAEQRGMLYVRDESGELYLYPKEMFSHG